MPIATISNTLGQAFWLLAIVAGPLVLFTWLIHFLEDLTQRRLASRFGWKSVLWTGWLGTPVHELSHALMCVVFRHQIVDMALFKPDPVNRRLGYVVHSYERGNWYQEIGNFFIGVAPLLGGTTVLLGLLMLFYPETGQQSLFQTDPQLSFWTQVSHAVSGLFSGLFQARNLFSVKLWLFLYLVICVGSHMGPSAEDYRAALWGGVLMALVLVAISLLVALVVPDSSELMPAILAFLVPVMTVLISVLLLCGLASAMVFLVTELYDTWRRGRLSRRRR